LREYTEFQLCREMGLTLEALRAMPARVVLTWTMFLGAEHEARERLREEAERAARRGRPRDR
jgi:hypothetical protein